MPRDLSTLPRLVTAEQVLDFMRAAPEDLLLQTESDLTPDEWNDRGSAVRGDDSIYTIVSLARSGVDNIPAYVDLLRGRHSTYETWPEELAIVDEQVANELIHDAEEGYADRRLSRGPFADMWVLRSHPQAETDDEIVKEFGHLPARPDHQEGDRGPFWNNVPQLTDEEAQLFSGWLFNGNPISNLPLPTRILGWLGVALIVTSLCLDFTDLVANDVVWSWIKVSDVCFFAGLALDFYYVHQDGRRRLKTGPGRIVAWEKPVTAHVTQLIQESCRPVIIDYLQKLQGTEPDNSLRFYHLSMLLTALPFEGELDPGPAHHVRPEANV